MDLRGLVHNYCQRIEGNIDTFLDFEEYSDDSLCKHLSLYGYFLDMLDLIETID